MCVFRTIERPWSCPYNCRMKILVSVMLTAVAVLACSGERGPQPTDLEQIAPGQVEPIVLAPAFGDLTFERPVALAFPGDDASRALVVEQPGRVLLLTGEDETWSATEFLDITDRVNDRGNEEGLLGLALDPDFESNGLFYVYYTASSPRRSVVSRFTVTDDDPDWPTPRAKRSSSRCLSPTPITTEARYSSDRTACCTSDWATEAVLETPKGNGQNPGTLLGSVLRIDVSAGGDEIGYTVPADNPFIGVPGARPEIWAYGLRNPWRFTFDRLSGELWAADVGQNSREEVDLIVPGGNYGWNVMEMNGESYRLKESRQTASMLSSD